MKKWTIFHANHLQKRKLKFISWFHSKFPGKYCWADCVAWSFSPVRFNPFQVDKAKACKIESLSHSTETCYCGAWKEGKCWDLLTDLEKEKILSDRKNEEKLETIPF